MRKFYIGVLLFGVGALVACTPQEKQLAHELEDLPGITCEVDEGEGLDDCHPDNLEQTFADDNN